MYYEVFCVVNQYSASVLGSGYLSSPSFAPSFEAPKASPKMQIAPS